ncbi:MAG: hypothetical protein JWM76_2215 [Pseudonocardiales bacterium]|nr:hypothetical protein [Pseudonocardiales bacterium]
MAVTKADPPTTYAPTGSLALVRTVIAQWGPTEAPLFAQLSPAQAEMHLTRQVDTLFNVDVLSGAERDHLLGTIMTARPAPLLAERAVTRASVPGAGVFEILSTVFPDPELFSIWDALEALAVAAASALGGLIAGPAGAALGAELALGAWQEWFEPALA